MSDQRDKILECACELYLADGLDAFSMRKLARRVGVTAPALYRHYESREHVLSDVLREAYREFTRKLYTALQGRTPLERFAMAGEGYWDFALKNARWYQLLFIAPEQLGMTDLPEDLQAMGCAVHQFWVDRVRECQDAGILREGDPVQISLTMWAHAHGMISLYHHGHFRMDEETFRRQFRHSASNMMAGLGTETFALEMAGALGAGLPLGVTP
jgi:AcrR family transcriptional regulator